MSTLDDLLSLRLDDAEQDAFIDQLRATKDKPEALWGEPRPNRYGAGADRAAQVDGKLGHLTHLRTPL